MCVCLGEIASLSSPCCALAAVLWLWYDLVRVWGNWGRREDLKEERTKLRRWRRTASFPVCDPDEAALRLNENGDAHTVNLLPASHPLTSEWHQLTVRNRLPGRWWKVWCSRVTVGHPGWTPGGWTCSPWTASFWAPPAAALPCCARPLPPPDGERLGGLREVEKKGQILNLNDR